MLDPRIILADELLKVGVNNQDAYMIALEAGSSQSFVDKEHLISEYSLSKEKLMKAIDLVGKFYVGV